MEQLSRRLHQLSLWPERPEGRPSGRGQTHAEIPTGLLVQIAPFLRSYKRVRAGLVRDRYVQLTPRNGKYTPELLAARKRFEDDVLALRANAAPLPRELPNDL